MPTMFEWILLGALILNAIASFVWARQYREAKNATIEAKDAQVALLKTQVDFLQQLRPKAVEEDHKSTVRQYEDLAAKLRGQANDANETIEELTAAGQEKDTNIMELKAQVSHLQSATDVLQDRLAAGLLPLTQTLVDSAYWSTAVAATTGMVGPILDVDLHLIEGTEIADTIVTGDVDLEVIEGPVIPVIGNTTPKTIKKKE